jgi:TonB family protein
MIKPIFFILLCVSLYSEVSAQKKDTTVYYIQSSGKTVSTKDSADFFVLILPPDTTVDKNLFIVKYYYRSGKVAMVSNSTTNTLNNLKFEGRSVSFSPNGRMIQISNYSNGQLSGDVMNYYPNGKLYTVKNYVPDKKPFLKQCNDSTGVVLAENGNGKWIEFDGKNFKMPFVEGDVVNGMEQGEWHGRRNDSVTIAKEYKNGFIVSSKTFDKSGKEIDEKIFTSINKVPEFPGGLKQFAIFLGSMIHYPYVAWQNGVQGRVIITFVVEKDGSLSDIKVVRGIGNGCDEEAIRVMRLSPRWSPGSQNGRLVRCAYTVPIAFTLSD